MNTAQVLIVLQLFYYLRIALEWFQLSVVCD